MKHTPVLLFHTTQSTYLEINPFADITTMHFPNSGYEPTILRSLTLRFNQLSYADAEKSLNCHFSNNKTLLSHNERTLFRIDEIGQFFYTDKNVFA